MWFITEQMHNNTELIFEVDIGKLWWIHLITFV